MSFFGIIKAEGLKPPALKDLLTCVSPPLCRDKKYCKSRYSEELQILLFRHIGN